MSSEFINPSELPIDSQDSRDARKYSNVLTEVQGSYYFFSVLAAGVGDYDGWGDIGENTEISLLKIFECVKNVTEKLFSYQKI